GWAILLRQKQKKLIMLPSETMIWQPEFTDKTLSRKPGAVQAYDTDDIPNLCWCFTGRRLLVRHGDSSIDKWINFVMRLSGMNTNNRR
ncbi:hypothetical protein, partial [Escherichia coli]